MNGDPIRSYGFSREAHWSRCLTIQADRARGGGLMPFAPYGPGGTLYATDGARAVAVTCNDEVLWRDRAGALHRLAPGEATPEVSPTPYAVGRARRMVATSDGSLWTAGRRSDPLEQYESDTLTHLRTVRIPGAAVLDLAGDERDGVLILVRRGRSWQALPIDCAGRAGDPVVFEGISYPAAFTYLREAKRFVVLSCRKHPHLFFFNEGGGKPVSSLSLAGLRPCFRARALGSDARSRAFVAGADGSEFGGAPFVLSFDGDGNLVGELPLDPRDARVSGVVATRDALFVAGRRGVVRFGAVDTVPQPGRGLTFTCVTPVLEAPDREDARRWLRIDATAALPEGTTLEIEYAATDDPAVRNRLRAIAEDTSLPASHRARRLRGEPGIWQRPIAFRGSNRSPDDAAPTFSAPLFDVRGRYLMASVTLAAGPGARLPVLSRLDVRYPGRSLMESLPAIFRRAEAEPDDFLRALVGVLETTTQDLDRSIAAMGSRVHPSRAPDGSRWLDFVARWLGWPWDDALAPEQKRAIAMQGAALARDRGTRAGLEALLDAIVPGPPRRFRVTDLTADFGFATVGGGEFPGSALPAMLGGLGRWSALLDSQAVLGYSRLPCPGFSEHAVGRLAGTIRVEVAATAAERRAWEPWLASLVQQMTPLTARADLRWIAAQALRGNRLDGSVTLDAPPAPHLGTDAVTGVARLPEGKSRLSPGGTHTGIRLG